MVRLPVAVLTSLLIALTAVAIAFPERAPAPERASVPPLPVIAARVEALRGLRFERIPQVRRITYERYRREFEDEYGEYPEQMQDADAALPTRLGLVEEGTDLREEAVEAVSGFYDDETGDITLVGENWDPRDEELTIAHELTHALEDHHFVLEMGAMWFEGDEGLAEGALTEGSATLLERRYRERHMPGYKPIEEMLPHVPGLLSFTEAQAEFPYAAGVEFVEYLYERGGWKLVDEALTDRPPESTEQVMHPELYMSGEPPLEDIYSPSPDGGAARETWGAMGEWGTREMLISHGLPEDAAELAAAGWRGDEWAYWLRGQPPCEPPCLKRGVHVMRWQWDTTRDAIEFTGAMTLALDRLDPPAGAALHRRGQSTTLVFAPTQREASMLSRSE